MHKEIVPANFDLWSITSGIGVVRSTVSFTTTAIRVSVTELSLNNLQAQRNLQILTS
ncbi:hypothetical protein ACHQM5_011687 [Ranunculus cassubicifolius]